MGGLPLVAKDKEKKLREERISLVYQTINEFLVQLPNEELNGLTYEVWHENYFSANDTTIENLVSDSDSYNQFTDAAEKVKRVFALKSCSIDNSLGLPLEGAIARSLNAKKQMEVKREADARNTRVTRLTDDTMLSVDSPLCRNWLTTPHSKLNGRSPIQVAEDSWDGLKQAKEILGADYKHANAVKHSSPNNSYAKTKGE